MLRDRIGAFTVDTARPADDAGVGLLVLWHHEAVTGGVHRQHRHADLAGEADVLGEVGDRGRIGRDRGRVLERAQVSRQLQPGRCPDRMAERLLDFQWPPGQQIL